MEIEKQTAFITPAERLLGDDLSARDLRGGAALVIAALEAEGTSVIHNAEIISRGYENIVGDLQALGAVIKHR